VFIAAGLLSEMVLASCPSWPLLGSRPPGASPASSETRVFHRLRDLHIVLLGLLGHSLGLWGLSGLPKPSRR